MNNNTYRIGLFRPKAIRPFVALFFLGIAAMAITFGSVSAQQTPNALSETYQTWVVSCRPVATENTGPVQRACQITQELRKSDNNKLVLAIALTRTKDGIMRGTLLTPLGLNLARGVVMNVDEKPLASFPLRTCKPRGCLADIVFEPEAQTILSGGQKLNIILRADGQEKDLILQASLLGFSNAATRLTVLLAQ